MVFEWVLNLKEENEEREKKARMRRLAEAGGYRIAPERVEGEIDFHQDDTNDSGEDEASELQQPIMMPSMHQMDKSLLIYGKLHNANCR